MVRELIVTTAAAAAVVTAAAPAVATAKDVAYDVAVDGQGTYAYADHDGNDVALTFGYHGEISDGVVFRDGSPLDTTGDDLPTGTAEGTYSGGCQVDRGFAPV